MYIQIPARPDVKEHRSAKPEAPVHQEWLVDCLKRCIDPRLNWKHSPGAELSCRQGMVLSISYEAT